MMDFSGHITLVWSTHFGKYLAFGESPAWGFSVSDDLVTWSTPTPVEPPKWWSMKGNSSITPITPAPGRWIIPSTGTETRVPYWVAPGPGAYKYKALCNPCSPGRTCEVCPDMGDLCALATPVPLAEFDAILSATMDFTCALVYDLEGYSDYIYPTLVDDRHHAATGADPSLNFVGQDAYVFWVANRCAGTGTWSPGSGDGLKCTIINPQGRADRNIVRSAIHFD